MDGNSNDNNKNKDKYVELTPTRTIAHMTAERMLLENAPLKEISRATGLPINAIRAIEATTDMSKAQKANANATAALGPLEPIPPSPYPPKRKPPSTLHLRVVPDDANAANPNPGASTNSALTAQAMPSPLLAPQPYHDDPSIPEYNSKRRTRLIDKGLKRAEEILDETVNTPQDLRDWSVAVLNLGNLRRLEEGEAINRVEVIDNRRTLEDKLAELAQSRIQAARIIELPEQNYREVSND
jgi:hypothetical protein